MYCYYCCSSLLWSHVQVAWFPKSIISDFNAVFAKLFWRALLHLCGTILVQPITLKRVVKLKLLIGQLKYIYSVLQVIILQTGLIGLPRQNIDTTLDSILPLRLHSWGIWPSCSTSFVLLPWITLGGGCRFWTQDPRYNSARIAYPSLPCSGLDEALLWLSPLQGQL